jgi:hypothetical protein
MRVGVHRFKLLPFGFLPMQPLDVNKNKKNLWLFAVFSGIGLRESSFRSVMFIEDAPQNTIQAPSGAAWR